MCKKILISALLVFAGFAFAQQYPANNSYSNSNDSYYSSGNNYDNDNFDYPDDYYYDYPNDYYPQNYYESYYNDYRNSIISINWSAFFHRYRLNRFQIEQIIDLNNRYQNFNSWDSYYGSNPDRWYYERFNALQIILGPQIFVIFQNHYYQGYNPVAYFQNYRRSYYEPRYEVRMPYRHINVAQYRVDKDNYKNPRDDNGLYDPNQRNSSNSLKNRTLQNTENSNRESNGFRNGTKTESTQSVRNAIPTENTRDNGFRSVNGNQADTPRISGNEGNRRNEGGFRSESSNRTNTPIISQPAENRGSEGGFRSSSSDRIPESTSRRANGNERGNSNSRGGGFR